MIAYLGALQIHQIIANLKEHANQIYKWNVVPSGISTTCFRAELGTYVHVITCGTARHHELNANS